MIYSLISDLYMHFFEGTTTKFKISTKFAVYICAVSHGILLLYIPINQQIIR